MRESVIGKEEFYTLDDSDGSGDRMVSSEFYSSVFCETDTDKIFALFVSLTAENCEAQAAETLHYIESAVDRCSQSEKNSERRRVYEQICRTFLEKKLTETAAHLLYATYFEFLGKQFISLFLEKSFSALKSILSFKLERSFEHLFSKRLGSFVGKLTLARNRIFTLEVFDLKDFLCQCIERRKITFSVLFTVNFLREGKNGIIFVPKNPYLTSILAILSEMSHFNATVKEEVDSVLLEFNVPLKSSRYNLKSNLTKTIYLANYSLESYDPLLRHVISLSIDFSVREICNAIIEKTCSVAIKSGLEVFSSMGVDKSQESVYFRNLLLNLVKSLSHISSHEPIRASISGNISYFLKNANLELETEKVYRIANDNLMHCCKLIERAAMSKILDEFSETYQRLQRKSHPVLSFHLPILQDSPVFDKIEVKPIEVSEFQDIKDTLVNISKKIPNKKINIVTKEWNSIMKVIEDEETVYREIERVALVIGSSEARDELAKSLCQSVVGYFLRCPEKKDVLFYILSRMFLVSFKTAKDVNSWLIYSEDERKFNVELVLGFVEYNLLNIIELDQYFAKKIFTEKYLRFGLAVLSRALLSEVRLCTPYDFISTIEALAKINGERYDDKIYGLLKNVSEMMTPPEALYLNENDEQAMHAEHFSSYDKKALLDLLDDYVKLKMFSVDEKGKIADIETRIRSYPIDAIAFPIIALSWDTFVRFHRTPSPFCHFKLDCLTSLLRSVDDFFVCLKIFSGLYLLSVNQRNYLYQRLFARFLSNVVDKMVCG